MKPEELMIGDIVNVHRCECVADGGQFQEWDEYGKVVSITEYYITIKYIGREEDYGFEDVYGEDINPIPLTTEILEKNEFYYENNVGHVLEHYSYEIIYDSWDHKLRILKNREQILNLEYWDKMCVHELQQAFRICGIDKEITI